MPLSKYTKIYPSPDETDSIIIYSTKNASALLVSSGLIEDIQKNCLSDEEKETLTAHGCLVRDATEEKREILSFIHEVNALDKTLNYIVVLNLDCNLGCTYCFEGERKGKFYLSDETADRFVDFVKRSSAGKEEIHITFYGGEPLLSMERIEDISKKLRLFTEQQGVAYGFSLVTNGTLLTPANVKRLTPLGLKSAKVTLDGPKEVHDTFRPFKSGAGSFDVIMRNVRDVSDLMRIQIGGNYTQEHYRAFPRLLDVLSGNGLTPDKLYLVKFDPVVNESSEFAPRDFHDGCNSINEPWVSEASLFLREEILKRGYKTQKVMPSPCAIEREGNLVVNYDGALYKCPGLIGRADCCVGDLKSGSIDYSQSHDLDAWKNEECLACEYLPLCFGGCKYMKLLHDGTLRGINCQKEYLDRTLAGLVAQDIKYEL
jgi:uncharacterized protein